MGGGESWEFSGWGIEIKSCSYIIITWFSINKVCKREVTMVRCKTNKKFWVTNCLVTSPSRSHLSGQASVKNRSTDPISTVQNRHVNVVVFVLTSVCVNVCVGGWSRRADYVGLLGARIEWLLRKDLPDEWAESSSSTSLGRQCRLRQFGSTSTGGGFGAGLRIIVLIRERNCRFIDHQRDVISGDEREEE